LGKLHAQSGHAVCEVLERFGFRRVRQRGSHIVMQRTGEFGTVTVPVPAHKELCIGTLRSIIRQSGIPREEFEDE